MLQKIFSELLVPGQEDLTLSAGKPSEPPITILGNSFSTQAELMFR